MVERVYGHPEVLSRFPKNIDFYVLSNEDIDFNANLVTGTNEVHEFALPYPSSIDLFNESLIVHAIDFILQDVPITSGASQQLFANLSMLDKSPEDDWDGSADDNNDEYLKAVFSRNITFGYVPTDVYEVSGDALVGISENVQARYIPPQPLDLVTPLFVELVNQSITEAFARANFTDYEKVQMTVWFTTRRLSRAEKSAREMQIRWQRLDS